MKKTMTRRNMLKNSALVVGGVCTCHLMSAFAKESDCCITPELEPESYTIKDNRIEIDLFKAPSLANPGHAAYIIKPDLEIQMIIVRPAEEEYKALTRLCTHGWQVLSYNSERRLLQCNSYNHSIFTLDGQVWKGPAPKPLGVFKVEQRDHLLIVYREEVA